MQPDLRSALRLVALLKHLGLVRLAVDGSSFVLAACAEFARRSGMTVLADDAPTRRRHNVIVLADPTGSTDFVWDGAQPVRELSMRLGCELLHRGFSFPLKSMPGGQSSYVPLPLYPFDRQRNHVVQDELDPACRFGKTSNIPSTPAGL
jgi:hypothetical protein